MGGKKANTGLHQFKKKKEKGAKKKTRLSEPAKERN